MTIDRWIHNAAKRHPDKTALEYGGDTISYALLANAIDACVAELTDKGLINGDRVAWYGLNHPDVFVLLFSCARIGAIFVPLNWRLEEPEIAAIVSDCEPSLLYYDRNFTQQALALPDVQAIKNQNFHTFNTTEGIDKDIPNSQRREIEKNTASVVNSDPNKETSVVATEHPPTDKKQSNNNTLDNISDDPILLVYTSGSTGHPKGALLSQKSIACNAMMSIDAHQMSEDDTALVMLPLFHVGGLNILATPALSIGATVILHEKFEPELACRDLCRATLAITVPTVLQAMMSSKQWDGLDVSSVRGISIGSTDVPLAMIESIHQLGIPMPQIYGATETGPFAIYQTLDNARNSIGSIGQAGSNCEIRLVTNGNDVGIDEPGEIWVKGANVLSSYWHDKQLTGQALQDGWFRTGDVATCDAHGFYWFKDRIKHVVISGGENIYPTEIERVLRQLPGVIEVSVVGIPDTTWGEIPVAVIVTTNALNEESVLASLKGQLARYKHPKKVVFVDALPRNAMGKVVADNVRQLVSTNLAHG